MGTTKSERCPGGRMTNVKGDVGGCANPVHMPPSSGCPACSLDAGDWQLNQGCGHGLGRAAPCVCAHSARPMRQPIVLVANLL